MENENQRKIDHANRSAELASKADKKQEAWITPTLLNGVESIGNSFQYRKTTYGTLQFKGRLSNLKYGQYFMILPTEYRVIPSASIGVPTNTHKSLPVLIDGSGVNWGTAGGVGVSTTIGPLERLHFDGIEIPLL